MVSALSVVIMLLTNIMPSMMYVIPIITGAIVFAVNEIIGKKWALGVFFVTSFISFILLTDKETALNYTLFFGYYPLLKPLYEKLPKVFSICTPLENMIDIFILPQNQRFFNSF